LRTFRETLDILEGYKHRVEDDLGLEVYAIMLKGSQNYGLDDDESDIDANLIFYPSLQDLRSGKTYKMKFETGEVTCHNLYSFAEIVAKGNPQWIEVCHTKYKIGKSLDMFKHYVVNPSALKGMVMEKVNSFSKLYPSRRKYVEQFGYDPKQLHHIVRLYDLLRNDAKVYKYVGREAEDLIAVKRGALDLESAIELRDYTVAQLSKIYEEKKKAYVPQEVDLETLDGIMMDYYKSLK